MDLTKLKINLTEISSKKEVTIYRPYYMGCGSQINVNSLQAYEDTGCYIAEPKFDGIWGAVIRFNKVQRIISRNGKDKKMSLPSLPDGTIIVGELGYGSQVSQERKKKIGHDFMDVIDILMIDGKDLKDLDSEERRRHLEDWHYSLSKELKEYYLLAPRWRENFVQHCMNQPEGLVLKKIKNRGHFPYKEDSKSEHYVKVKKIWTVDAVITGYNLSDSDSFKGLVGDFVFSVYKNGKLFELGAVGNLTKEMRKDAVKNWDKYKGKVIEIECYKIFESGSLRHPSMLRIRDDKDPKDCTFEEIIKLREVA